MSVIAAAIEDNESRRAPHRFRQFVPRRPDLHHIDGCGRLFRCFRITSYFNRDPFSCNQTI